MTTRDLYISLLDREPDYEILKEFGCIRPLRNYDFLNMKYGIIESPEYKSKDEEADVKVAEVIRNMYTKHKGVVDGEGVYNKTKLVSAGYMSIGEVERLVREKEEDYRLFEDVQIQWPEGRYDRRAQLAHVVSLYDVKGRDGYRIAKAMKTWVGCYNEKFTPAYVTHKHLPTLHEVISDYIEEYKPPLTQYMVYTNADILLCNDFGEIVLNHIHENITKHIGAYFSFRRDFKDIEMENPTKEYIMDNGKWFSGVDVFVFPLSWWMVYKHMIPEMYIGRPYWDLVLRYIIAKTNDVEVSVVHSGKIGRKYDITGINAHILHENEGFKESKEKDFNCKQAMEFFKKEGIDLTYVI